MWNLPLHWVTKEIGKRIGGVFNRVREVIISPGERKEGKHLKVLVELDLNHPILRATTVRIRDEANRIKFRYEKCPDFCYYCGKMGHNERNCKDKSVNIRKEHNMEHG